MSWRRRQSGGLHRADRRPQTAVRKPQLYGVSGTVYQLTDTGWHTSELDVLSAYDKRRLPGMLASRLHRRLRGVTGRRPAVAPHSFRRRWEIPRAPGRSRPAAIRRRSLGSARRHRGGAEDPFTRTSGASP